MPALPTQHRTTRPSRIHTITRAENETQKGHNHKNAHAESSFLVKRHRWRPMSETETPQPHTEETQNTRGGRGHQSQRGYVARRQRQKEEKRCRQCGRGSTCSRRAPFFHVAHSGNQLPPNRQTLYPYASDPNNLAHPRCENTTDPNRCCALARLVLLIDEP